MVGNPWSTTNTSFNLQQLNLLHDITYFSLILIQNLSKSKAVNGS